MSGYLLYYIPGVQNVTPQVADRFPAIRAAVPNNLKSTSAGEGPCGLGAGAVLACIPDGVDSKPKTVYRPNEQTWLMADGYAVGYWNDAKPMPEDLARPEMIAGYPLQLEHGSWLIPVARLSDGTLNVPQVLRPSPGGGMVKTPAERYAHLVQYAQDAYETIMADFGGESQSVDEAEVYRIACECLAVNYYVGKWEIGLLGALTDRNVSMVSAYLADLPGLVQIRKAEESKKNEERETDDT